MFGKGGTRIPIPTTLVPLWVAHFTARFDLTSYCRSQYQARRTDGSWRIARITSSTSGTPSSRRCPGPGSTSTRRNSSATAPPIVAWRGTRAGSASTSDPTSSGATGPKPSPASTRPRPPGSPRPGSAARPRSLDPGRSRQRVRESALCRGCLSRPPGEADRGPSSGSARRHALAKADAGTVVLCPFDKKCMLDSCRTILPKSCDDPQLGEAANRAMFARVGSGGFWRSHAVRADDDVDSTGP